MIPNTTFIFFFNLNLLFNWDCSSLALFIEQFLIKFNIKKFWNSGRNPAGSGRIPGQIRPDSWSESILGISQITWSALKRISWIKTLSSFEGKLFEPNFGNPNRGWSPFWLRLFNANFVYFLFWLNIYHSNFYFWFTIPIMITFCWRNSHSKIFNLISF